MAKKILSRGIASLFSLEDESEEEALSKTLVQEVRQQSVSIELLYPNPDQPRRFFEPEALNELSESIIRNGVLQPILARPHPFKVNAYEIIAGERRWQASQKAGLTSVPVIIKNLSDSDVIEIALIENMHRRDLNVLEEAAGYKQLIDQFDYTQEKLASVLARSRSHIANLLRLLSLPETIQEQIRNSALSASHARALVGIEDSEKIAHYIIEEKLSVRQTEQMAQALRDNPDADLFSTLTAPEQNPPVPKIKTVKDIHVQRLQKQLSEKIGLKVRIKNDAERQRGKVTLSYTSLEEFDRIKEALESLKS